MRYELLLQSATPGAPFPVESVEARLAERPLASRADGSRTWPLPAGRLEVEAVREGGQVVAYTLRVALTERDALVREAVGEGATLAAQAGVLLFDPQLMRPVGERDADAVAVQYLRTARYAGEMAGVPEAVAASFAVPQEGLKPGTRVLLGLAGLLFVAFKALDWLLAP